MKKLLPYILILVAFIGVLNPSIKVRAADPLGTCTVTDLVNKTVNTAKEVPHLPNCDETNSLAGVMEIKWTPDSTTGTAGTCVLQSSTLPQGQTTTFPKLTTEATCRRYATDFPNYTFVSFGPAGGAGSTTTSYQLLAPLPNPSGGTISSFNTTGAGGGDLGKYLGIMITLFIGICAVLAVIMIVLGGIEYMTSELISNKEEGKKRITNAILGLLLALGAWTLLNTINPNLLNTSLSSLAGVTVDVSVMGETETGPVAGDSTPPAGPTSLCPEGITSTVSGVLVCARIAQKLDNMITTARTAGIILTVVSGYRSVARQTALRIQNCNGNTTDRSVTCTPPTAIPGFSNHNNGLAVDLNCGGARMQGSACFTWLQANAGTYLLYNLPSEPWHWSVDGH